MVRLLSSDGQQNSPEASALPFVALSYSSASPSPRFPRLSPPAPRCPSDNEGRGLGVAGVSAAALRLMRKSRARRRKGDESVTRREARQRLICVDRRAPGALCPRRLLAGILQIPRGVRAPLRRNPRLSAPAPSCSCRSGCRGSAGRRTGRSLVSAPPEKRVLSPTTASKSASGAGSPAERRRGRDHVRAPFVRDISPHSPRTMILSTQTHGPRAR